jgi:hypothetical protein
MRVLREARRARNRKDVYHREGRDTLVLQQQVLQERHKAEAQLKEAEVGQALDS